MIYEYAIEPDLLARWGGLADYRYFVDAFGLGRARILSELPKKNKWRSRVLKAATGLADMERKRVEALADFLIERVIARGASFDGNQPWLENAEREHERCPLRAILATENPRQHIEVLTSDDIGVHESWVVGGSNTPPRSPTGLAAALAPMLRVASEIVMVDPYFDLEHSRFRRPMEHLLKAIRSGRPGGVPARIEILTSDKKVSESFFSDACRRHLPTRVPVGYTVRCVQLREKQRGELLHNRYVMTDVGGVRVEPGLDDGDGTYDINLMTRTQYDLRWSQYAGLNRAFDVGTPVEIRGSLP